MLLAFPPPSHSLFSPLCLIGVADPNLAQAFDLKTKLIDVKGNARNEVFPKVVAKQQSYKMDCKQKKNLWNKAAVLSELTGFSSKA